MNFRNKTLIFLAAAVWLFPSLSNASIRPAGSPQVETPPISAAGPSITISTLADTTAVAIASSSALSVCNSAQDQAALLNQPADCFDVSPASLPSQPQLVISELEHIAAIKVFAAQSPLILSDHLSPALPEASVPVMPLPFSAALASIISIGVVFATKRIKKLSGQFSSSLSLSQLQMRRC